MSYKIKMNFAERSLLLTPINSPYLTKWYLLVITIIPHVCYKHNRIKNKR